MYLPDLLNLASVALTQLNYQHANDVEEEEEVQLWAEESNTVVAVSCTLNHLYQRVSGITMPIIRCPSNCRCSLWFPYKCGGGSVLSRSRFASKPTTAANVEVKVFSAVVGLLANRPRL